jgi:hypothetical protein
MKVKSGPPVAFPFAASILLLVSSELALYLYDTRSRRGNTPNPGYLKRLVVSGFCALAEGFEA